MTRSRGRIFVSLRHHTAKSASTPSGAYGFCQMFYSALPSLRAASSHPHERVLPKKCGEISMLFEIAASNAYMSDNEKFLLSLCAASLPQGSVVVEIGAFLGGSAHIMLLASAGRIVLHSVDIEDKIPNDLRSHRNFTFHLGTGAAVASREALEVDMLFVDGDHSFRGIREDILAFWPQLRDGALVVAHDVLNMQHLGVRIFVETLLGNGNLTKPVHADTMVAARVDKRVALPAASDYVRTARKLSQVFGRPRSWIAEGVAPAVLLSKAYVDMPPPAEDLFLVGKGKRGDFVHRFLGLDYHAPIDSWEARRTDARYYVCSAFFPRIFTHLVWDVRVAPENIFDVTPQVISRWMLQDILNNKAKRLLNAYQVECERELVSGLLNLLSESEVYRMYENGFLCDLFLYLTASFPPQATI